MMTQTVADLFFPTSYFVLLLGLMIGFCISGILFGSVSLIALILGMYIGVIRLQPVVHMLNNFIKYIFPDQCESFIENMALSFPVECSGTIPKKAIYLFHPHGLLSLTHGLHIGSYLTKWPERNIVGTVIHTLFHVIGCAEIMGNRFVPSNYDSMKEALDTGKSLSISIGGIEERLHRIPGQLKLKIKDRKGAFKLAIQTGVPLVPVLVYGENELLDCMTGWWVDIFDKIIGKPFHLPLSIPTFNSLGKIISLIYSPFETPVHTVIGEAVPVGEAREPTDDDIRIIRAVYIKSLCKLYKDTKPNNYSDDIEFI